MNLRLLAGALALACCFAVPAEARGHHHNHSRSYGGLPWCGIYLGQYLGKPDRKLWLARNWASEGRPAGGPAVGAVVVWPHHVGIIEGQENGQWVVRSGNDGGRVRVRPRSLAGAIAFRYV